MSDMKDVKKRPVEEGKMDIKMVGGPAAKRVKLDGAVPPPNPADKLVTQMPLSSAALAATAAATATVIGQGGLAGVAAAANLMGPMGGVPPNLVGGQAILTGQTAAFPNPMQPGVGVINHNQIKAFLDHISLGQYWRLLSENGCDSLDDLATVDVQMLVNLGFKVFHANRLVTAVHRFMRPAAPVMNTSQKRKRASHVRTFAEMYQRIEEFNNLVKQVGSMSAAERDPRSTISRGAYVTYKRIKELAEKENISLTSEKYVNVKPTEKNVKEIIAKEKEAKRLQGQMPGVSVPTVPDVNTTLDANVANPSGVPQVLQG
uniref:SAM domain-containing protein n=1 Tax=Lotharella oceanica TaxID=641309 RepID=A0A7S2TS28_9EUKA|eukprot:CAMPEP_0170175022 /NCGR_PEP_ID=MMETSP0040_2-20121228/8177_1 /TAXON_ID=641309 /ORGANISM="Lotharella oceanica, Strain CCMP622" /LENGTH=316 /DNA_ID=CAMNT_0010416869 /DNA_START=73 /DNA_END=1023 /DNA_ORIENTATION=+